jgi:hypothetical protein
LSSSASSARRPSRGQQRSWWSRLTATQICLIAVIVGVTVGMLTGIVVLLAR